MSTLNISLPDAMTAWLEARAATGGYGDVSAVVHDVVRREQERCDRVAAMQRHVDEARASGVGDETMADLRERARRQAERRPPAA